MEGNFYFEVVKQMIEHAPDATLLVDPEGTIRVANLMASRLTGYALDELLGHSVELLVPESHRGQHQQQREAFGHKALVRPMAEGRGLLLARKDRLAIPVTIALVPISAGCGRTWTVTYLRPASFAELIADEAQPNP